MASQTLTNNSKVDAAAQNAAQLPIPASALETLTLRFRPGGVFTLLIGTDGAVRFHDASAGMFFQRYVLPMLQYREPDDDALRSRVRAMNASSGVAIWDFLPGVVIAAFPYVEKKQLIGILAIAAKSNSFKLGEDVVRNCSRLGLDGVWLSQQAEE